MRVKVWDEMTYPFPNFNCAAVEVWEWISHVNIIIYVITYGGIKVDPC